MTVPFVWRLSPLHPGYVMTVCALTDMDQTQTMAVASRHNGIRGAILRMLNNHNPQVYRPNALVYITSHENGRNRKSQSYCEQKAEERCVW